MKKNNLNNRLMNFELLRVVSMILIILAHYAGHGGIAEINDITINKIIGSILEIGGKLGTNLFVLITGYFMTKTEFSYKKLFKLILQVYFYSIIFGIILPSLFYGQVISVKLIVKSLLPISYNSYWFSTAYVGLYLLLPYIKKFILSISKDDYRNLLKILFVILVLIPTIFPGSNPYTSNFIIVIFICLLGAYINLYENKNTNKYKFRNSLISAIVAFIFIFCSQVCSLFLSCKFEIFNIGISYMRASNTIPMMILSLSIFSIFKNMSVKNNTMISIFGRTSFGVYLFHEQSNFKNILWKQILRTENYYYSETTILIAHILFSTLIIYFVGTIIDLLREKIVEKPIFSIIKWDNLIK